jgi:RNA polymerase sigma factor, sigma-70 family
MRSKEFQKQLIGLQAHLLNFAFKLTSNREDANDLLQETSLKVLDNEDNYVENHNFKSWAFTIMRNLFINNYRKMANYKESSEPLDFNLPLEAVESPEEIMSVKEINSVLKEFSEEYRVPISMYMAGYMYQEIADKLGLPLGTVKSRIFLARKLLLERLKDFVN